VKRAQERAERGREDDDDEDGDDDQEEGTGGRNPRRRKKTSNALPGETFTIVCSSSLVPTVVCLVGLLDKAVAETEALLKLREKRGSNLDATSAQSSSTTASASVGGALAIREMLEDDNDDRLLDATNTQANSGAEAAAAMRARARQALREVDDKVYQCLHKAFEAAVCLLYRSVADAAERVIGLFTKLFKLQVGYPITTWQIIYCSYTYTCPY
jgi:hypothetical protein